MRAVSGASDNINFIKRKEDMAETVWLKPKEMQDNVWAVKDAQYVGYMVGGTYNSKSYVFEQSNGEVFGLSGGWLTKPMGNFEPGAKGIYIWFKGMQPSKMGQPAAGWEVAECLDPADFDEDYFMASKPNKKKTTKKKASKKTTIDDLV